MTDTIKRLSLILAALSICTAVDVSQERMSPALASLVAAERAFAKTSVEKGVRESFLQFFADDGINFQPHPTRTREAMLKRPAPAIRPPVVLNWSPAYADVSMAGDLGYTTGPFTFTDQSPEKRPTRYGFYFSIWKKQADGSWKVVVDAGIQTPDHSGQDLTLKVPSPSEHKSVAERIRQEAQPASLVDIDREFLRASTNRGIALSYRDYLDANARLHRNDRFPIIGRDAIISFLNSQAMELNWEPITADVSQSSDLGYTYGRYELKHTAMNELIPPEKGYYVRVWKRNKNADWKLVLDTFSPIPRETK